MLTYIKTRIDLPRLIGLFVFPALAWVPVAAPVAAWSLTR